jgi:hypothetical protein
MKLGEPRVAVAALHEFHNLQVNAVCEETPLTIPLSLRRSAMNSICKVIRRPFQLYPIVPHQGSLAFTSVQLSGMNSSQRVRALSCLANLLMLAAGWTAQEVNDDQC